jgi:Fe-S-cluster containining protein
LNPPLPVGYGGASLEPLALNLEPFFGLMNSLENYFRLVEKVDELCLRITERFRESISCRRGCDACCRHLTLFPVEGAALAQALKGAEPALAENIRIRALEATPDGPCPLLENGDCLLYEARPLICRTHGLPLLSSSEGEKRVDFCPENFRGLESLPGSAVIDLEMLNSSLVAVNTLFVREVFPEEPGLDRGSIAEWLLGGEG